MDSFTLGFSFNLQVIKHSSFKPNSVLSYWKPHSQARLAGYVQFVHVIALNTPAPQNMTAVQILLPRLRKNKIEIVYT